jgi:hypothetical protein
MSIFGPASRHDPCGRGGQAGDAVGPPGGVDASGASDQGGKQRAGGEEGGGPVSGGVALPVPIIHPCWSGSMPVLVEGAAEPVPSADIEVLEPIRIGYRSRERA